MAEPVLGELDEAPPLLTGSSGEESEAEAHGGSRSNYSGGPPHLTSESSGGEGDDLLGQPRATSLNADFLLGGTAAAAAAVAQQARLQPGQRRPLGSLDEIDQSDYGYTDEGDGDEEEWEPLYGGPGLAGVGGPAFAGGASLQSALLGGGQLAELGELELDEGLLQQVPIQELLEAVLQGVGGGPLAGLLGAAGDGGRGRAWGFGAHGSRIFDALAVDASQLPAGLEGSARRHALLLAEQGFVTALDPARHAACAAEGIPGGRQQGTPPHRRAHGEARAAPAAASRAGLQRADSAAGGGGLQRGDSAAGGGGLQRGDSAASQGLNPLARQQRAASGQQPGAPLSRLSSASLGAEGGSTNNRRAAPALAGLAEGEAAGEAAGAVAGSDDNFDMPPLVSEESSSVSVNGSLSRMQAALQSGSSGSSSDDEPGSRSRRRSSGTASERQLHQAPPPRGRQRRNAIFGQLPGLGAGTSQAAMGRPALPDTPDEEQAAGSLPAGAAPVDVQRGQRGGAPAADSDGDLPPLLDDLSDGSSAGRDSIRGAGRSRAAAARAACPRRLAGSSSSSSSTHSGNGPPALESRSESEGSVESSHGDAGEGMPHQRASGGNSSSNDRGSGRRQLPLRQSGVSAGGNSAVGVGMLPRPVANEGGSEPPGLASEEGDSESEGGPPGHRASGVSHPPDLTSDGSYSSSLDDLLSPLRTHAGRHAARRFTLRRAPAHQQQAGHPAQGGQGFTADQRDVMQALTSLLPPQQDGVGWAELAAHVRSHRASAQRGGSGGGVQLLSRLVAAAASQFPGEAEAAGLTERPLAPLPTSATASPVGASAGASSAVSRAASAAPDGRAAEAEAWIHLQQHVQGAQSPAPPPPQQQQQQRPPTSLGVGGEGAGADLRQQLEGAVQADLQAQLDSGAAQRAQHAQQQSAGLQQRLPQPADGAGSSISAAAAAGAAAAEPAEGGPAQPPRPFASGTQPEAAAGQPGAAALAALTASMPGAGSPQGSVASTVASAEAALRLLSLPEAAAAQHPLPPLVAAALAAARAPPPDQPEE